MILYCFHSSWCLLCLECLSTSKPSALSVNHLLVNHWLSVESSGTLLPAVFPYLLNKYFNVLLAHRMRVSLLGISRISLEDGTKEALNTWVRNERKMTQIRKSDFYKLEKVTFVLFLSVGQSIPPELWGLWALGEWYLSTKKPYPYFLFFYFFPLAVIALRCQDIFWQTQHKGVLLRKISTPCLEPFALLKATSCRS